MKTRSPNRALWTLMATPFLWPVTANADATNLAANPAGSGMPSPMESDHGWGCGADRWDINDGRRAFDTWCYGLAFTGGNSGWGGEPCGPRQATINFGQLRTFNRVVIWQHGDEHTPANVALQVSPDGSNNWVTLAPQRTYRRVVVPGQGSGTAWSDEYTFAEVSGFKVRYAFNNCENNIVGTPNIHGWIYEMEVYADGTCAGDFDENGSVGIGDLAILLAHFGMTDGVGENGGDIERDGDVDLGDLTSLLSCFGTTCP